MACCRQEQHGLQWRLRVVGFLLPYDSLKTVSYYYMHLSAGWAEWTEFHWTLQDYKYTFHSHRTHTRLGQRPLVAVAVVLPCPYDCWQIRYKLGHIGLQINTCLDVWWSVDLRRRSSRQQQQIRTITRHWTVKTHTYYTFATKKQWRCSHECPRRCFRWPAYTDHHAIYRVLQHCTLTHVY